MIKIFFVVFSVFEDKLEGPAYGAFEMAQNGLKRPEIATFMFSYHSSGHVRA